MEEKVSYKHEEKVLVPAIPSYCKEFVHASTRYFAIPSFVVTHRLLRTMESLLSRASPERIEVVLKRRVTTGYGVKIIEMTSRFFDERVDERRLKEAERILRKYRERLEDFMIDERVLRGKSRLEGYVRTPFLGGVFGGTFPIEGDVEEVKPSAFSSFELPKDRSQEYKDALSELCIELYHPMKEAFKSEEIDKNFKHLMECILPKERITQTEVVRINDYVASIHEDLKRIEVLNESLHRLGLSDFYKLSKGERYEKLRELGVKVLENSWRGRVALKLSEHHNKFFIGGLPTAVFSGMGTSLYFYRIGESTPALMSFFAGLCGGIGSMVLGEKLYGIYTLREFEKRILERMESEMKKVKVG